MLKGSDEWILLYRTTYAVNHITSSYTCSQDRQYGLLLGCISYLSCMRSFHPQYFIVSF